MPGFPLSRRIALGGLLAASGLFGAGEKATAIVIVADSRGLSGFRAWWANLYNENHLYTALFTVIAIPLAGAILGGLADLLMGRIGIDLKSRALREG